MIVFLDELREGQVDMILVWVRVLRCALQVLDGLGADLEVLLCYRETDDFIYTKRPKHYGYNT